MKRSLLALAIVGGLAVPAAAQIAPPTDFRAVAPDNDTGRNIAVSWTASPTEGELTYLVYRTPYDTAGAPPPPVAGMELYAWLGDWQLVYRGSDTSISDDLYQAPGQHAKPRFVWRLSPPPELEAERATAKATDEQLAAAATTRGTRSRSGHYLYAIRAVRENAETGAYEAWSRAAVAGPASPRTAYFNTKHWFYGAVVLLMAIGLLVYFRRIKADPDAVFIRRIAGVDAIEDAVGRSTEMGRPVLYVTGTDDVQNIQTIASLLVLGRVAEMTAEYDTEIKVANLYPLTMVVAEEIVRQGFADAGRIDAHKPENVMFISSEQFAYAAGVNGIILRDRPATNIYLGRYFAESLILAETGYVTGAVQIAGTAEIPQLPFFIAACDYTLIGEELYAVSAYLTREPGLLAMLKATDAVKLLIMVTIIVGMALNWAGVYDLRGVLFP